MSIRVVERLLELGLLAMTTHEDRLEIDREVERVTGKPCDEGVMELSDEVFRAIVDRVLRRKRRRGEEEMVVYA